MHTAAVVAVAILFFPIVGAVRENWTQLGDMLQIPAKMTWGVLVNIE
jgi:hypothetical protein